MGHGCVRYRAAGRHWREQATWAQDDEIEVIDVSTGQSLGKVDPPGIDSIGRLGKITRTLGEIRTESSAPAEAGFANSFA